MGYNKTLVPRKYHTWNFNVNNSYPIPSEQFTNTWNLKLTEKEIKCTLFITSSQTQPFLPPSELVVVGIVATAAATAED